MSVTFQLGTIVTLIATIVSAIISGFITLVVARNKREIEIVTANRVQWITEIKKLFSEYLNYTKFYPLKNIPKDSSKWIEDLNLITKKISIQMNPIGKKDEDIINLIRELNKAYEKMLTADGDLVDSKEINDKVKENIDLYLKIENSVDNCINDICLNKYKDIKKYSYDYYVLAKSIIIEDLKISSKISMYLSELIEIHIKIYLKCEWERIKIESKKGFRKKYDFDKEYEKIQNDDNIKNRIDMITQKIMDKYSLKENIEL